MTSVKKIVFAKLPNTGLGNMIYVWAKALVFARMNEATLYTSSWWRFHIGPYIRGEEKKRWYWGFFKKTSLLTRVQFACFRKFAQTIIEPPLAVYTTPIITPTVFVMERLDTLNPIDSFKDLKLHRSLLKVEFERIVTDNILERVAKAETPVIGMHIRRGDFRLMGWLLPLEFFRQTIHNIRDIHGTELPVTIFTDGSKAEMSELLAIANVKMASPNPDIVDLLLLSKSKIIVISTASTFSYWAAFFSEAPILRHPNNNHEPMRPDSINKLYYEGIVSEDSTQWPDLLISNIKDVK